MSLKWSRSMRIADIGVSERPAPAIRRLRWASIARRFGRPVSASVAARSSASARLRRLASTGAAWMTESWMRRGVGGGARGGGARDAAALGVGRGVGAAREHRADDLAADEQRLARRLARQRAADVADDDLVAARALGD